MTHNVASLIKETSTTTGTGTYTLLGAASGYRTFDSAGGGAYIYHPYVCRMGSNYEIGIGELLTATTLARIAIIESSNADAAVNWGAGTKDIYMTGGALSQIPGKHRLNAGTDYPGAGDNYLDGYSVGSVWVTYDGTSDQAVHQCSFAGDSSNANAIWTLLGTKRIRFLDTTEKVLAVGPDTASSVNGAYASVALGGDGAVVRDSCAVVRAHGYSAGSGDGGHQTVHIGGVAYTTNATPTLIDPNNNGLTSFYLEQDSFFGVHGIVTARNNADDVNSMWEIKFGVKRVGAGDPVLVGSLTKTVIAQDAGAAAWDVTLVMNTALDGVDIMVTGQAAKNILWTSDLRIVQTAFT